MITIKNISAEDLLNQLSLYEEDLDMSEEEFIKESKQNGYTYEITIETLDGNYNNTIWQNKWNSSNEILFDVCITQEDFKSLVQVGQVEIIE